MAKNKLVDLSLNFAIIEGNTLVRTAADTVLEKLITSRCIASDANKANQTFNK